jgi:hypothetical protein
MEKREFSSCCKWQYNLGKLDFKISSCCKWRYYPPPYYYLKILLSQKGNNKKSQKFAPLFVFLGEAREETWSASPRKGN